MGSAIKMTTFTNKRGGFVCTWIMGYAELTGWILGANVNFFNYKSLGAERRQPVLEPFEVGLVFQCGDTFAEFFDLLLLGEGINSL